MRPYFPSKMKSITDVRNFAEYLLYNRKTTTHPDDRFEDYVNTTTGLPVFTPDECEYFNSLMEEAFVLCDSKGVDIYEIWHSVYYPQPVNENQ